MIKVIVSCASLGVLIDWIYFYTKTGYRYLSEQQSHYALRSSLVKMRLTSRPNHVFCLTQVLIQLIIVSYKFLAMITNRSIINCIVFWENCFFFRNFWIWKVVRPKMIKIKFENFEIQIRVWNYLWIYLGWRIGITEVAVIFKKTRFRYAL